MWRLWTNAWHLLSLWRLRTTFPWQQHTFWLMPLRRFYAMIRTAYESPQWMKAERTCSRKKCVPTDMINCQHLPTIINNLCKNWLILVVFCYIQICGSMTRLWTRLHWDSKLGCAPRLQEMQRGISRSLGAIHDIDEQLVAIEARLLEFSFPWRIHGAGIYANIKGVYWWYPWHTIFLAAPWILWVWDL